ncbi:unknown protein [Simkania negevensis Z]|uniref:Uncharacterized protein n=1 Tax=Simkania negevensis (strain ATCC VR-1471 / DSM 27360 / Z) TaxID=331113 RepID=F8L3J4_SIMNZ|nr:unknown protein [Simkania negevensis Z]
MRSWFILLIIQRESPLKFSAFFGKGKRQKGWEE